MIYKIKKSRGFPTVKRNVHAVVLNQTFLLEKEYKMASFLTGQKKGLNNIFPAFPLPWNLMLRCIYKEKTFTTYQLMTK